MTELEHLAHEASALRSRGTPFLLATVMRVRGSAYRRPGARMLVAEDRWVAGSVSGGCLEGDIVTRGPFRTRSGAPVLVTYDSTSDDDIAWGFGLGCNGVVEVLIERIDAATRLDPTRLVERCITSEARGVVATVFASDDAAVPVGARLLACGPSARGDGASAADDVAAATELTIETDLPAGELHVRLAAMARHELLASTARAPSSCRRDVARGETHAFAGHHAEVVTHGGTCILVEHVAPPPHVFVLGSGHDAVPVVTLAKAMGWHVTVADTHARYTTHERFHAADRLLVGTPETIRRAIDARAQAFVIVMTHDFDRDRALLGVVLGSSAFYVGVLGPERRTARLLAELAHAGAAVDEDALARLHAPVGLHVGAETPHEIALAMVAEMQAAMTGAPAGRLRERPGTIHGLPRERRLVEGCSMPGDDVALAAFERRGVSS